MKMLVNMFRDLHEDKSGAAFIEYTALLGLILAVGIAVLSSVGTWAGQTWTYLCAQLPAGPSGSLVAACSA